MEIWIAGEANIEGYLSPQLIRVYVEIHPETPMLVKRWERVDFSDVKMPDQTHGQFPGLTETRHIPKEKQIGPVANPADPR